MANKERSPRVQLSKLHHVHFEPQLPPFADKVELSNISTTGLGFLKKCSKIWPVLGQMVEGDLVIERVPYEVQLRVTHISSSTIGCRFENPSQEFLLLLERYFETELSALTLKEVSPKFLKANDEGESRLIQGSNNCQLYLVKAKMHPHRIERFKLLLFGNYIEGSLSEGTRVGSLLNSNIYEAGVIWEDFIPEPLMENILKFFNYVPMLSKQELKQLKSFIEDLRAKKAA